MIIIYLMNPGYLIFFPQQFIKKIKYQIKSKTKTSQWNSKSLEFWRAQEASYSGVLLGHESLNDIDIASSERFLQRLIKQLQLNSLENVLDCGAGVGRVSKQLLCSYFNKIDILEQTQEFVNTSKILMKDINIGNFYCQSLQDFNFSCRYSSLWIQWTLTHLREEDTIAFLKKAKLNLKQNGFIVVKQNISESKKTVDYSDSTIVRTDKEWKRLFYECKFKIIEQQFQTPWPEELQKVKLYALV